MRTTFEDELTGAQGKQEILVMPVGMGAVLRAESGRTASWAGASAVIQPHRVDTRLGGEPVAQGFGIGTPGLELVGGAGLRIGPGEILGEAAYLFGNLGPGSTVWQGPMGGLRSSLGFRLLY